MLGGIDLPQQWLTPAVHIFLLNLLTCDPSLKSPRMHMPRLLHFWGWFKLKTWSKETSDCCHSCSGVLTQKLVTERENWLFFSKTKSYLHTHTKKKKTARTWRDEQAEVLILVLTDSHQPKLVETCFSLDPQAFFRKWGASQCYGDLTNCI